MSAACQLTMTKEQMICAAASAATRLSTSAPNRQGALVREATSPRSLLVTAAVLGPAGAGGLAAAGRGVIDAASRASGIQAKAHPPCASEATASCVFASPQKSHNSGFAVTSPTKRNG